MNTKDHIIFSSLIIGILLTAIYNSANAGSWDYYYEPVEIYDVYPTLPGTDIRDYSRPGYRVEVDRYDNERAYPTLPGTDIRDYSRPGRRVDWR